MNKETKNVTNDISLKNSIFRIGCVFSVEGREVRIKVDKQKNSSHLLYKGNLLKNISVDGYLKIIKGFISIIAKVVGEYVKEEKYYNQEYKREENKIDRILKVHLLGYIENNQFERGIKELPLIDNQCFLLDREEFSIVHDFIKKDDQPIKIGSSAIEKGQDINIGINSIFASHIGIFGNTGSGKSYTLAKLYRQLFLKFQEHHSFKKNARFLLFDFNGEYNDPECIISNKTIYNLTTKDEDIGDKLQFNENDLLNIELFSILANATEKTQRPFLKRSLNFYKSVMTSVDDPLEYFKNILRNRLRDILLLPDKMKADLLLNYVLNILPKEIDENGIETDLIDDIIWHGTSRGYYLISDVPYPFNQVDDGRSKIEKTKLYNQIDYYSFKDDIISKVIDFMYLQLIYDVCNDRAQNEHISPAINKLKAIQKDIDKVLEISNEPIDFWKGNFFAIINLNNTKLDIKKLIPLLISRKLYIEHKKEKKVGVTKSLNIIVDEAHNILSYISKRESETWKDYRLETFEEIIKEGRKFGVFLTIASQRPADISTTIISQLHNYFIHRLINERDIETIGCTVSYLDKVSYENLPILPTGACVLAGITAHVPVVVAVDKIEKNHEPNNRTINLLENWIDKKPQEEIEEEEKEEEEAVPGDDEELPF